MVDAPKTSFIPKQTFNRAEGIPPTHRRTLNIFNIIAAVVFLTVLLLAVGVYFYGAHVKDQLATAQVQLTEVKGSFSQSDIERIRELDQRMRTVTLLLENHIMPTRIFDMLEARTQSGVQFDSFEYLRNESGSVIVDLGGKTRRFNTLALQEDQLNGSSVLETVILSNVDVSTLEEDEPDVVVFSVFGNVVEDEILFEVETPEPVLPDIDLEGAEGVPAEGVEEEIIEDVSADDLGSLDEGLDDELEVLEDELQVLEEETL